MFDINGMNEAIKKSKQVLFVDGKNNIQCIQICRYCIGSYVEQNSRSIFMCDTQSHNLTTTNQTTI